MKKLLLTAAFLSTFTTVTLAQEVAPAVNTAKENPKKKELSPEQAAQRQSTKAADELGLNAEQKQKFYDYSLTRITANRPLKAQAQTATDKATKKKIHQQIKANRDAFDKNVNAILSPDQQTKWAAQKNKEGAPKEGAEIQE